MPSLTRSGPASSAGARELGAKLGLDDQLVGAAPRDLDLVVDVDHPGHHRHPFASRSATAARAAGRA